MPDSAMYQPTVVLPRFRLVYPELIHAKEYAGKVRYGWTSAFDAKTDLGPVRAVVEEASQRKWGQPPNKVRLFKSPFRPNTDLKVDVGEPDGKFIACKSEFAGPGMSGAVQFVGPKLEAIDPLEAESLFYSGCYCKAIVTTYAWTYTDPNSGTLQSQGVSFNPVKLQFAGDGEPFRMAVDPDAELEEVEDVDSIGRAEDGNDVPW